MSHGSGTRLIQVMMACAGAFPSIHAVAQDPLKHFWSGALTARSIRVNAMVDTLCVSIRLVIDDDAQWASPLYSEFGIITDTTGGMAHLERAGLEPGAAYVYRFEVNGVVDTSAAHTGRFRTPEEGPMDFSFVVGSCNSDGNHPVWQSMAAPQPLFFLSTGDLHYADPNSLDVQVHRDAYLNHVYLKPPMMGFFHGTPIAHVWDDHDFCGDLSTSASLGKASAAHAFRENVPHYPLWDDTAVYQAFTIGRVRFILSDTRSEKTDSVMMSDGQYAWLKSELLLARDSGLVACWATPLSWNAIGYPENWGSQPDERTALSDWMLVNGIRDLFILCGDAHMLAIDDGANGDFSTTLDSPYRFPVFQAAAINRGGSYKGGTYNQGGYFLNPSDQYGQFGEVIVEDDGLDVCITFNGWRTDSMAAAISLMNTFTFCRQPTVTATPALEVTTLRGWFADGAILVAGAGASPLTMEVFDMLGRSVEHSSTQVSQTSLRHQLRALRSGAYVATIEQGGTPFRFRFVVP